ncbi:MAG: AAA family ATPase [Erysipelotrichaceae bacterium]|nr:AAA family ATPase [Erysipelotrichaceae bacterium]
MKLIFLFGDAAVGKMTVGQELTKITNLKLFHNHMMIEPVLEIFGTFHSEAIKRLRDVIFEEFAKTQNEGMIFTFMWAFDQPSDWEYVEHVRKLFGSNTEFYYVELIADQQVRIERNKTENRLNHKASKRDLKASEKRLIEDDKNYRCISNPGEIPFKNYLRIDNTHLAAQTAANLIKETFHL